jgi:hypothetical protein
MRNENNNVLLRNWTSDVRSCSAMDHQIGSDEGWKSKQNHRSILKKKIKKKKLISYQITATTLNTQLTPTQRGLMWALRNARLLLVQRYGQ